MSKTRRQIAREKATICIYQNLLVQSSFEEMMTYLNEDQTLIENKESMEFSQWLIKTVLENKESYQDVINKYLKKGWNFDRLGVMEKSILLVATCELLESELPKKIVINEAVINAKQFCDEDAYRLINGVLSRVM